jgi:peptide/nickel transport system substrate-binding protein
MYDSQVPGVSVTVIKSPYYYDKYAVHLDKIVFKALPDPAAALAALQAGDIQVLDNVSPFALASIQESSSLRVLHANGTGWRGIVINLGNKNGVGNLPYTNVGTPLAASAKLRQAFEEAIDRNALNKVVYAGTTQVGCTPMSPAGPDFDASIQCTPYNPNDARKLVAQSGIPNPTVHLIAEPQLAQFIQAEEAAVGINVVVDSVANATAAAATPGNFDTFVQGPSSGENPDQAITDWVATSGSRNYAGYSNPRLDLILANSRKATTPKALRTLYHAAQKILLNDRPIIFLNHSVRYVAFASNVAGVEMRPDLWLRVAFAQYK